MHPSPSFANPRPTDGSAETSLVDDDGDDGDDGDVPDGMLSSADPYTPEEHRAERAHGFEGLLRGESLRSHAASLGLVIEQNPSNSIAFNKSSAPFFLFVTSGTKEYGRIPPT